MTKYRVLRKHDGFYIQEYKVVWMDIEKMSRDPAAVQKAWVSLPVSYSREVDAIKQCKEIAVLDVEEVVFEIGEAATEMDKENSWVPEDNTHYRAVVWEGEDPEVIRHTTDGNWYIISNYDLFPTDYFYKINHEPIDMGGEYR